MSEPVNVPVVVPSQPSHWCKKLRWKSYTLDRDDASAAAELFVRGGQVFTCLTTVNAYGEDDGPVAPECCHDGRGCYVEHPTLVMLRRSLS
jgi:hypothetical protein